MPQPCKVMIVEEAGAREPLKQRLLEHYHLEFRSQRVDSEAELRALARDFSPDLVLSTDDLPDTPEAEAQLMRLLSRQRPELLVCEVGDGNAVRWQPRAGTRRGVPQPSVSPARRDRRPGSSFSFAQGLPEFFERSTDAVVIVDAEGWIGFANGTACMLLGRYFPEPVGTYLAAGQSRGRGMWADDALGPNVIKLRVRQPRPVHGLVVFEASTRVATRVHLEDLVRAKTARGGDRDGCLPLVALELGGLQLLSENYGRGLCDEMFSVITAVVQPQYARCGLVASLGNGEHLVVLPNVSEAADAAVAVQGRQARVQDYAMTDEFKLFDEPANDPPVLREVVTQHHAPLRATPATSNHLGDALRRSAISVHYQPQYDMDTGEGCGVEALARWTLSTGETLMPGAFLPIAERTGMIGRLGAAVLDDACAMAKTWRGRECERLTISVNVSTSQINSEYTRTLAEALKRCGFPARRLELEIDESALIEARAATLERIREWRAMGVRIAVNHLGSNYSSLAYLSHIRVDRLKLDRSVVQRMTESRPVAGFVHAVIALGHEFDVDVMAQGVETAEQLEMLREMGCRHVQGFLLARPMPAVQAQLALRRHFGNLPRTALGSPLPAAQAN